MPGKHGRELAIKNFLRIDSVWDDYPETMQQGESCAHYLLAARQM